MNIPPGPARLAVVPDPIDASAPTMAELNATGVLDDVTLYRYDPPEPECDHGATYTGPAVITLASTHYGHSLDSATALSDPFTITLCLICHHLAPTPQEDTP